MRVSQEDLRPDQDIVRPGTSAALTARAIDATPPPPLVQAQEAVAAVLPRIVDAVPSPLLGASPGLTLLLAMTASQRVRLRMSPVLMSGLLLMPVSNYHAAQEPAPSQPVEAVAETRQSDEHSEWRDRSLPRFELVVPPELVEGAMPLIQMVVPDDWSREDAERFLRRNTERLRREVRRLREKHQLELRGRVYTMEHRHHSERH